MPTDNYIKQYAKSNLDKMRYPQTTSPVAGGNTTQQTPPPMPNGAQLPQNMQQQNDANIYKQMMDKQKAQHMEEQMNAVKANSYTNALPNNRPQLRRW